MTDLIDGLKQSILEQYLNSGDFNGLPIHSFSEISDELVSGIVKLIENGSVDLVRGDGHPNPHIKAHPVETIEIQVEKILQSGLEGCLYPTAECLKEVKAGKNEEAPFTRELLQGAAQLEHRAFDLRALDWYRNDPRFEFETDDIHGRILQKEGTQIAGRAVVPDRLEFMEFGFGYNTDMKRVMVAFLRYLHDLPRELQQDIEKYQLNGEHRLHPDFHRTQLIGAFPQKISIYDAFLEEKYHINKMCELIGKKPIFKSQVETHKRPDGFGILLRATNKEYRSFALQLDQLLSDDLNSKFFSGDIETTEQLTKNDGSVITRSIGTIALLQTWVEKYFRPTDPEPMEELWADFRAVRKARQKPAHKQEENSYDEEFILKQQELIKKGFNVVHTLRMVLENHPKARDYKIPDYLREVKVWTR